MNLLFSWAGRIGRGKFWLGNFILILLSALSFVAQLAFMPEAFDGVMNPQLPPDLDGPALDPSVFYGIFVASMLFGLLFALGQPLLIFLLTLAMAAVMILAPDAYYDLLLLGAEGDEAAIQAIEASRLSQPMTILMAVIGVVFSWAIMAIAIKRTHDRGQSGWWLIITLIPFIGMLWWLVNLGVLAGEEGPNVYGNDPRGRG